MKSFVGDNSQYHLMVSQIDDYISQIEIYSKAMTPQQLYRLQSLCGASGAVVKREKATGALKELTADEVTKQYSLFLVLQASVVDHSGNFLNHDPRAFASMVSSMSSLINLFLKAQEKINKVKELSDLKASVIRAVKTLSTEAQEAFFDEMEKN